MYLIIDGVRYFCDKKKQHSDNKRISTNERTNEYLSDMVQRNQFDACILRSDSYTILNGLSNLSHILYTQTTFIVASYDWQSQYLPYASVFWSQVN